MKKTVLFEKLAKAIGGDKKECFDLEENFDEYKNSFVFDERELYLEPRDLYSYSLNVIYKKMKELGYFGEDESHCLSRFFLRKSVENGNVKDAKTLADEYNSDKILNENDDYGTKKAIEILKSFSKRNKIAQESLKHFGIHSNEYEKSMKILEITKVGVEVIISYLLKDFEKITFSLENDFDAFEKSGNTSKVIATFVFDKRIASISLSNKINNWRESLKNFLLVFSNPKSSNEEIKNSLTENKLSLAKYSGFGMNVFFEYEIFASEFEKKVFRWFKCSNFSIQNSVKKIGDNAFQYSSIKEITIPESVLKIGKNAFSSSAVKNVTLNGKIKVLENAFSCAEYLNKIELPKSLVWIKKDAFKNCTSLQTINIPSSVKWIDSSAFKNCVNLEEIELPKKLKTIEQSLFVNCTELELVTLNEGITKIKKCSFKNCIKLKSIILPTSLTEIGENAFENCVNLEGIKIPENVRKISRNAFKNCTNLRELIIDSPSIEIHKDALLECSSLTKVRILDGSTAKSWMENQATFYQLC